MTHTTSKAIKAAFERYQTSDLYTLRDCYARPSENKERAMDYCIEQYHKWHGRQPRIIGYNSMVFSFGFIGKHPENGLDIFVYITRDYDRYIYLDEMGG